MYNVYVFDRTAKTYSRIDFENKDAKGAWKLYFHWKRKYFFKNYYVILCKDEYVITAKVPSFKIYDNLNFGPIVEKIKSTKPNIEPLGGAKE